jgi:hypothetical protein
MRHHFVRGEQALINGVHDKTVIPRLPGSGLVEYECPAVSDVCKNAFSRFIDQEGSECCSGIEGVFISYSYISRFAFANARSRTARC